VRRLGDDTALSLDKIVLILGPELDHHPRPTLAKDAEDFSATRNEGNP
jgi:hypothetical protein